MPKHIESCLVHTYTGILSKCDFFLCILAIHPHKNTVLGHSVCSVDVQTGSFKLFSQLYISDIWFGMLLATIQLFQCFHVDRGFFLKYCLCDRERNPFRGVGFSYEWRFLLVLFKQCLCGWNFFRKEEKPFFKKNIFELVNYKLN